MMHYNNGVGYREVTRKGYTIDKIDGGRNPIFLSGEESERANRVLAAANMLSYASYPPVNVLHLAGKPNIKVDDHGMDVDIAKVTSFDVIDPAKKALLKSGSPEQNAGIQRLMDLFDGEQKGSGFRDSTFVRILNHNIDNAEGGYKKAAEELASAALGDENPVEKATKLAALVANTEFSNSGPRLYSIPTFEVKSKVAKIIIVMNDQEAIGRLAEYLGAEGQKPAIIPDGYQFQIELPKSRNIGATLDAAVEKLAAKLHLDTQNPERSTAAYI